MSDLLKDSASDDHVPTTLRIGHSPDPDDAFMWYPLVPGPDGRALVDTGRYRFEHVLEDIESLNQRSERGELEITALSIHQYPFVADRYALTSCGSSMGEDYGPMVVAGRPMSLDELRRVTIAVPGQRTTAFLTLSLMLGVGQFQFECVPFDEIIPAIQQGRYEAGLIIHEGQLTYARHGLQLVADLGRWWMQQRNLPLPLGGNAIRRDLGLQAMREICTILLRSIRYALDHRRQAVDYALKYARGMDTPLADRFVGMYVNHWTLDYGPKGRQAVQALLSAGVQAGLLPGGTHVATIDFVDPEASA